MDSSRKPIHNPVLKKIHIMNGKQQDWKWVDHNRGSKNSKNEFLEQANVL